jgi:hypothetical protein
MSVEEPLPRPNPADHQDVPDYDEDLGDDDDDDED